VRVPQIDPYNVAALIPDFEEQFADFRESSNRTRQALRCDLDVAYGPAPRQRLDLFHPPGEAAGRPVHMFIHGGYWRGQVKEDYAVVADGITAVGAIAAVVEYTLMPGNRMGELVREVREAAQWLATHAHEFGGDGSRLSASGHSAGGHLVTYLASRAPHETALPPAGVRGVISISGIFDLRPIAHSYLQPELNLTEDEIAQWSPIEAVPGGDTHYEIVVGQEETAPFHQQAQDFAYVLERHGARHERVTMAALDHMSVLRDMGRPGSPMWQVLRETIGRA
jgi:arylformamidase